MNLSDEIVVYCKSEFLTFSATFTMTVNKKCAGTLALIMCHWLFKEKKNERQVQKKSIYHQ